MDWLLLGKWVLGVVSVVAGALGGYFQNQEEQRIQEENVRRSREAFEDAITLAELGGAQAGERYADAVAAAADLEAFTVGEAEERRTFTVGEAAKERDLIKQQALEDYNALLEGNLDEQRINRMMANREYMDATMQGAFTEGAAAAQMAQSGVRRTGSAAGILSETTRLFDVDLALIDEQLAIEEGRFGRERTGLQREHRQAGERAEFGYEAAVSGAGFTLGATTRAAEFAETATLERAGGVYEQSVEQILGRDITQEDLFGGEIDFSTTLLTEGLGGELAWATGELEYEQGAGMWEDILLGALGPGISAAFKLI